MRGFGRFLRLLVLLGPVCGAGAFTVGPDGWTILEPSPDSLVVYVSSSQGNDENAGTSALAPVHTIAEGMRRLRDGFPDHLRLKRGDVWHEEFGFWGMSGRSAAEPIVVESYGAGTARPRVIADNEPALRGLNDEVNYFAFTGMHLQIENRDEGLAPTGIRWLAPTSHLLFEDLLIEGFSTNVVVQGYFGTIDNFQIRRCTIIDSFDTETLSQGMYCENVDGILIEECLFDYNGWHEGQYGQTVFNHNIYIHAECSGLVARGNIISRSSSHGLQARPGGVVENNVFVRCPVSCSFGYVLGGSDPTLGGVGGQVRNNVFLEGNDIADKPRGIGLQVGNIAADKGAQIENNYFVRNDSVQPYGAAIELQGGNGLGINQTLVQDNVCFGYNAGLTAEGVATKYSATDIRNNYFLPQDTYSFVVHHRFELISAQMHYRGNVYGSPRDPNYWFRANSVHYGLNGWKTLALDSTGASGDGDFPDSGRSLSSYSALHGFPASVAGFLSEARNQSRLTWTPACMAAPVVDYIRVGFGGEPAVQYAVATETEGNGTIALSPASDIFSQGQLVTFTATPQVGHRFLYWEGDLLGVTANPTQVSVTDDMTVRAVFASNAATLYSIEVGVHGLGAVQLLPPGNQYPLNTPVVVTAVPRYEAFGNHFVRFEGDLSSQLRSSTLLMTDHKSIEVYFEGVDDLDATSGLGLLMATIVIATVGRRKMCRHG